MEKDAREAENVSINISFVGHVSHSSHQEPPRVARAIRQGLWPASADRPFSAQNLWLA